MNKHIYILLVFLGYFSPIDAMQTQLSRVSRITPKQLSRFSNFSKELAIPQKRTFRSIANNQPSITKQQKIMNTDQPWSTRLFNTIRSWFFTDNKANELKEEQERAELAKQQALRDHLRKQEMTQREQFTEWFTASKELDFSVEALRKSIEKGRYPSTIEINRYANARGKAKNVHGIDYNPINQQFPEGDTIFGRIFLYEIAKFITDPRSISEYPKGWDDLPQLNINTNSNNPIKKLFDSGARLNLIDREKISQYVKELRYLNELSDKDTSFGTKMRLKLHIISLLLYKYEHALQDEEYFGEEGITNSLKWDSEISHSKTSNEILFNETPNNQKEFLPEITTKEDSAIIAKKSYQPDTPELQELYRLKTINHTIEQYEKLMQEENPEIPPHILKGMQEAKKEGLDDNDKRKKLIEKFEHLVKKQEKINEQTDIKE